MLWGVQWGMSYRDDLQALRNRHDELAKELGELRRQQARLADVEARAASLEKELAQLRARLEETQKQRKLPLLDDLRVASPCSASWDEMVGDDRVRFCLACEKNVYNVSAMSRDEAEALIADAEGDPGLCLRMYRRADGTVLTADCPVGRRRRRVTRIAAAALAFGGAGMALASFGQTAVMGEMVLPPAPKLPPTAVAEPVDHGQWLMGDVAEPLPEERAGEGGADASDR
ncbi:MAG: hypothetical protein KC731_28635 [Myxococcales bacterium]|nr:hypothetical protein [Myxococcales bacterium]